MAALAPGTFSHARAAPAACASWLTNGADLWATTVTAMATDSSVILFDVRFTPPPPLPDYPEEHVRITICHDGRVYAVPVNDTRTWKHRYQRVPVANIYDGIDWHLLLGALCLWYPDDPPHLQWTWSLGLDRYVRIVQRHLWSEEYNRRYDSWPAEDAPHGHGGDGQPHPIATGALRIP